MGGSKASCSQQRTFSDGSKWLGSSGTLSYFTFKTRRMYLLNQVLTASPAEMEVPFYRRALGCFCPPGLHFCPCFSKIKAFWTWTLEATLTRLPWCSPDVHVSAARTLPRLNISASYSGQFMQRCFRTSYLQGRLLLRGSDWRRDKGWFYSCAAACAGAGGDRRNGSFLNSGGFSWQGNKWEAGWTTMLTHENNHHQSFLWKNCPAADPYLATTEGEMASRTGTMLWTF